MSNDVAVSSKHSSRPTPIALGINVEKPKFPQCAVYAKRLESFEAWPEYLPVDKNDLAEAGLVYTGVGDSVRCYFCGGGLRNWERGDVPMEEHAKWYPKCPHLLLVKGQAYIEKISRGEKPEPDGTSVKGNPNNPGNLNSIDSAAAQSCIQMGYTEDMVQKAIEIHVSKYEPLETLLEENQRLKESQICKICLDNIADIIFLPCGHRVSCPQCAPALVKCPVCRKTVNGHIKSFLAATNIK